MKRNIFTTLAIFAFIVSVTISAFAQTPERISLTSASPAIVWEKSVGAESGKMLVIGLKKGQKIKISYIEDTKQGTVDFGKNSLEEGVDFDYDVEVTKDYMISLYNPNRKATSFRIFFSLETTAGGNVKPTPKAETIRLSFEGSDESKATRTIQPGQTTNFVFPGETGLKAHVIVKDPSVSLTVDFCGRMIPPNMDETCKLNRAGDWTVMVRNDTDSPKRYTIEVTLDVNMAQSDEGKDEVKIQFPKGETEHWVEGSVSAEGSKIFYFTANKGQKLTLAVYDETNQLKLDFNKNPRKLNTDVKYVLNASGEWAIYLDNPTNKEVSYRLYISIN